MFAIIAAVSWIALDVAMTLITSPPMPLWQWRTIVFGGLAVIVFTVISELIAKFQETAADKARKTEMADLREKLADLREKLIRQDGLMQGIGITSAGTLDLIYKERSDQRKDDDAAFHRAVVEIGKLETKLAAYETIFWRPLSEEQKNELVLKLRALGKYSLQISCTQDRDVIELASDVKDCFVRANWTVLPYEMKGGWRSALATGFEMFGRNDQRTLNRAVMSTVLEVIEIPVSLASNFPDGDSSYPDIAIVVGPRKTRDE